MANQQNAHAMGLQEGYSQEQWGPWKSHGLLLQQAISELSWQENAAALRKLFVEHSKSKEGYLSRDEFIAILQRYPCCNAAYHAVFFELFDRNSDGYLNECDFLGGVLAVSPLTPHKLEAPSGQLRMQFIFLYYDANRNGRLEVEEVAMMIEHIQQLRGNPHSDAMVDATALVSLYSGPFGFAAFSDAAQKKDVEWNITVASNTARLAGGNLAKTGQFTATCPTIPLSHAVIDTDSWPARCTTTGWQTTISPHITICAWTIVARASGRNHKSFQWAQ